MANNGFRLIVAYLDAVRLFVEPLNKMVAAMVKAIK